jgi:hypothetical protein
MCDHHDHDHDQEHPADRAWEPEDPMLMMGSQVMGDPEFMLQCLVEEYAHMGWDADAIAGIFHDPSYQATAGLTQLFGREGVRQRIERTLNRCGVIRVRTFESNPRPEDDAAPATLTVRGQAFESATQERYHG